LPVDLPLLNRIYFETEIAKVGVFLMKSNKKSGGAKIFIGDLRLSGIAIAVRFSALCVFVVDGTFPGEQKPPP
jgi:hypothetical protein